ncbi:MAG: hypothetical protein LBB04_02425 [Oscillospiraceae bacterium]|jgi:hypothetical protein|nr:hypothetical protein [Oscillospiraceae bacterium]
MKRAQGGMFGAEPSFRLLLCENGFESRSSTIRTAGSGIVFGAAWHFDNATKV